MATLQEENGSAAFLNVSQDDLIKMYILIICHKTENLRRVKKQAGPKYMATLQEENGSAAFLNVSQDDLIKMYILIICHKTEKPFP